MLGFEIIDKDTPMTNNPISERQHDFLNLARRARRSHGVHATLSFKKRQETIAASVTYLLLITMHESLRPFCLKEY